MRLWIVQRAIKGKSTAMEDSVAAIPEKGDVHKENEGDFESRSEWFVREENALPASIIEPDALTHTYEHRRTIDEQLARVAARKRQDNISKIGRNAIGSSRSWVKRDFSSSSRSCLPSSVRRDDDGSAEKAPGAARPLTRLRSLGRFTDHER